MELYLKAIAGLFLLSSTHIDVSHSHPDAGTVCPSEQQAKLFASTHVPAQRHIQPPVMRQLSRTIWLT